tara:strand:+ start:634 stop:765 length:132 start_codon:yes stop_codon:yes gene_type:complete
MAAQYCPWLSSFHFVVVFLKLDVIQPSAVRLVPLNGFSDAMLK